MSAPPDLPEDRAEILADGIYDVLTSDEFADRAEEAEREISPGDSEQAQQTTEAMLETWQEQADLLRELLE